MGFLNPRAICPSCGGKIHAQSTMWNAPRTGTVCPHCGTALTGKVGFDNKAKPGPQAPPQQAPPAPQQAPPDADTMTDGRSSAIDDGDDILTQLTAANILKLFNPARRKVGAKLSEAGYTNKEVARSVVAMVYAQRADLPDMLVALAQRHAKGEIDDAEFATAKAEIWSLGQTPLDSGDEEATPEGGADAASNAPTVDEEATPEGGADAASNASTVVDELTKVVELHRAGALTDEEFAAVKKKLLS